jgi:broad specificity phosphatase PhoE
MSEIEDDPKSTGGATVTSASTSDTLCASKSLDTDNSAKDTQVFWIMRHGDRLNNVDRHWKKTAQYPHDTPLSELGHNQARDVASHIVENDSNIQHIISSPFLRALETANPLSKQLNMPIKVEKSVWETGCAEAPPLHLHKASNQFLLDNDYESSFVPTCGENTNDFFPRLSKAATGLLARL